MAATNEALIDKSGTPAPEPQRVVSVRPEAWVQTAQRLPYFLGLSQASAGTRGLSMHLVVIPPGASAAPHRHRGYETGIYVLEGRVETRHGEGLRESVVSGPGEFLFIPPDVPHQAINLSSTEPARAVVARNHAGEVEDVEPYSLDPSAA